MTDEKAPGGRHRFTPEERARGARLGGMAKSAKQQGARRTAAYKHGIRARSVGLSEAIVSRLRKLDPDAPELIQDFIDRLGEGSLDESTRLFARSMIEHEIIRAKIVEKLLADGLTIDDTVTSAVGVVSVRIRAHPLLEFLHKLQSSNLATAESMLATKKSRGEGAKDAAMTAYLERSAMLRAANKSRLPPPAAIETTAVPGSLAKRQGRPLGALPASVWRIG